MILDKYFVRPVFYDYLFSSLILIMLYIADLKEKITLPKADDSYDLTSDVTNIALTLAGFILTIITVLITFKDNSKNDNGELSEDHTAFARFFSSDFYFETIIHLKNCIKSVMTIAALGFFLKLFISEEYREFFFFFNALGVIIIITTIWRCTIILGKVLELQKNVPPSN